MSSISILLWTPQIIYLILTICHHEIPLSLQTLLWIFSISCLKSIFLATVGSRFLSEGMSQVCLTPSHLKTAPSVYLSTTSLTLRYWCGHSWSLFLTPALLLHLYLCVNSWWFQNLYGWTLWSPSVRSFLSLPITCSSIPSQPLMLTLHHHSLAKPEIIKPSHPLLWLPSAVLLACIPKFSFCKNSSTSMKHQNHWLRFLLSYLLPFPISPFNLLFSPCFLIKIILF